MPATRPGVHVTLAELLRLEHKARGFTFLPRQPVHSLLSGRRASRVRGRGLDFEELRNYLLKRERGRDERSSLGCNSGRVDAGQCYACGKLGSPSAATGEPTRWGSSTISADTGIRDGQDPVPMPDRR